MEIHIDWEGPFSLTQAKEFRSKKDYGLYQFYGDHPVYGQQALLYIGKAEKQNFSQRISQHNWDSWSSTQVDLFFGRIFSEARITESEWERQIDLAERILLFSHSPSFNTSNLNNLGNMEQSIHLFNWGRRKSLLPEVSTTRWNYPHSTGHRVPSSLKVCETE